MLTSNQTLQQGRYRIVDQIGQNGTGARYEAVDTVSGANVLLKEMGDNSGKVATPIQIEARKVSFAKKAKALVEMRHESLLPVKDFFSEVDRHYLVTELSDGAYLGELLEKNKKPFSLSEVSAWADSLLDALNYLHTLNPQVIHGEVKPQNVKLTSKGRIKLLVFNLAKNTDEASSVASNQMFDAAVLPYMPLEQIWKGLDTASKKVILTNYDDKSEKILEQPIDARSDVYSVAATLYYLLTGRIPADALTRSIDILEGQNDPLQSPTVLSSSIPQEVSEVLMKALEIKREDRFSSAVIMRQVLRTAFVRVKEREAAKISSVRAEEDAVLEIPVVQAPPVVAPVAAAAARNPEIQSEQARQLELIKQQLREAEERRLEAEARAEEAEARLLEAEKHVSIEPAAKETPVETFPAESHAAPQFEQFVSADFYDEPQNQTPFAANSSDELPDLFAEPQKEGGAFKKIAAAAVGLIVLGGAGFGIWTFTQTKSNDPMSTVSTTNAVLPSPTAQQSAPQTETAPSASSDQATVEPAVSTSAEDDAAKSGVNENNPASAVKAKTTATPTPQTAQVKKTTPTPAAAKTPEVKKKVTLDDLLKDN